MATKNECAENGCKRTGAVDFFHILPEGCTANILSFTSPRDACRMSKVGSTFRSAAESDVVWERFLPSDYQDILAQSVDREGELRRLTPSGFGSKKEFYLYLCDHPLIINGGTMSLSLDKWSGKKCYMLAARGLSIVWGNTPEYWRWTSIPESRFSEVAVLLRVCWLEIHGKINTSMLSPYTIYAAYLVFKSTQERAYGFEYQPAEVSVGISGREKKTRFVYFVSDGGRYRHYRARQFGMFNRPVANMLRPQALVPRDGDIQRPKQRGDGWLEIELGEYFNKGGEDEELGMTVMEVKGGNWKSGLIFQGIELRPKGGK